MIRIESIDERSPYLEDVKRLWRANSDWLGFYPEGAFLDRARRGQIIVALNETGSSVATYCTTSRSGEGSGSRISCIKEEHRG